MRAEQRHVRRYEALGALRLLAGAVALTAVAGCGAISIKPDPVLPKPLLQPLPGSVGLVLPNELRNYVHKERRWGADWLIALGPGHVHLLRDVFKDSFHQVQEFKDLAAARAATGLNAVFEPLIDQYSFVTDRDTGGRYDAVTIRYRINLYTPQGEKVDTLTLTGYGSALAKGLSNGKPLEHAQVRSAIAKAEQRLDGQGRLVVRPSGTEPVIRIMGEGDDRVLIEEIVEGIAEALTEAAA